MHKAGYFICSWASKSINIWRNRDQYIGKSSNTIFITYKRYYIPWYTFYDLSVSNLECLLIRIVIGIETQMIGKAPRGLVIRIPWLHIIKF